MERRINMQGINPLTMKCTYETPCGWCAKWNKKCDEKIPERGLRAKINPVDDADVKKLFKEPWRSNVP
jgi:hypothetical protein